MLLVAYLADKILCKKPEKWLKPWHLGIYLRVLGESYPMNTSMTARVQMGFKNLLDFVHWTKVAQLWKGHWPFLFGAIDLEGYSPPPPPTPLLHALNATWVWYHYKTINRFSQPGNMSTASLCRTWIVYEAFPDCPGEWRNLIGPPKAITTTSHNNDSEHPEAPTY